MLMESMSMKNQMQLLNSNEQEVICGGMNKHTSKRYDRNGVEIKNKRER